MRSRIWSPAWLRLMLSLVVVGAVFSSPIRVVPTFARTAKRLAHVGFLRRNFATVNARQTRSPNESNRVRFPDSLQDANDEIALEESSPTWAFSILPLVTDCQRALVSCSLPILQSSLPLRC